MTPLRALPRRAIVAAIDALIAELDFRDGDPDREPDADPEPDADREPDADPEPDGDLSGGGRP